MPRIDRSAVRRERRRSSPVAKRSGGVKIPGVYALLLDQERVYGGEPDPRWAYSEAGRRGDPYPANWRGSADLLPALEAGEPVQVSDSRLSGLLRRAGSLGQFLTPQRPDGRVERLFWDAWTDRSIGGLLVHADDIVMPMRMY